MIGGHDRSGDPAVHGGQRSEVTGVSVRLAQVSRCYPGVANVDHQGRVEVLGLEEVLLVQFLRGLGRRRQVSGRIVLLRALQLAGQRSQRRHHQDPERDHQVFGPAAANDRDQSADAAGPRFPLPFRRARGPGISLFITLCFLTPCLLAFRPGVPAAGGDTGTAARRVTGRPRGPAHHVVLLTIKLSDKVFSKYDVSHYLRLSSYILNSRDNVRARSRDTARCAVCQGRHTQLRAAAPAAHRLRGHLSLTCSVGRPSAIWTRRIHRLAGLVHPPAVSRRYRRSRGARLIGQSRVSCSGGAKISAGAAACGGLGLTTAAGGSRRRKVP